MENQNKPIESVQVIGINDITMEDGSVLKQCSCMTSKNTVCVIYRPEKENPQIHDLYDLYLSYNSKLKPVIKYVKETK